jgi:serine/threonine protein phosphatase 1
MSEFSYHRTALPARTPDGVRIYAIGDIHGRADLLRRLLGMIDEDIQTSLASRHLLVFLGDYLDRGANGRAVVDLLLSGPPTATQGIRWLCLCGNHEDALLDFLEDSSCGPLWLANGGWTTVESYAGLNACRPGDLRALQTLMKHTIPSTHRHFLQSLPLWHVEGDYLFVHAGLRPGLLLDEQNPADLLWIRDPFLYSSYDHGKMIVHGHSIVSVPEVRGNRIGIDTGACYTGRLTALVLEGAERRFLST